MNFPQIRRFITTAASAIAAITICMPARAQQAMPAYLVNAKDPVQLYMSQALVGFAFQKKCVVVGPTDEASYQHELNRANLLFQGYVLAKGFVSQPSDAVSYSREMIMGAIRFAAQSGCDESTRARVDTGHRVAKDFQALIDPYMNQPLSK